MQFGNATLNTSMDRLMRQLVEQQNASIDPSTVGALNRNPYQTHDPTTSIVNPQERAFYQRQNQIAAGKPARFGGVMGSPFSDEDELGPEQEQRARLLQALYLNQGQGGQAANVGNQFRLR